MPYHFARWLAVPFLPAFLLLTVTLGCSKPVAAPPAVKQAGRVVLVVAKKLAKIGPVAVDWATLYVEIKATIDGKEEAIEAHLTKEEAEALKNGGHLVIKGEDGTEFPIEYRSK